MPPAVFVTALLFTITTVVECQEDINIVYIWVWVLYKIIFYKWPSLLLSITLTQTSTEKCQKYTIQFDDLGFGDTGYNGGDFPTPILDDLANNNAIKLNFHYTEQVYIILNVTKTQIIS